MWIFGLIAVFGCISIAGAEKSKEEMGPEHHGRAYIYLENALVRVSVDDSTGSYALGTSSIHPTGPCERFSYAFDCTSGYGWSSHVIVEVDGVPYLAGGNSISCATDATHVVTSIVGNSIISNYTIASPPIAFQLIHTPEIYSPSTGGILLQTAITNNDSVSHDIAVLYEYDTMVADNDGANLSAGGVWYPGETCFDNPTFTYWEGFEDTFPPDPGDLISRGILEGAGCVRPDRFAIGQWTNLYYVCWSYACTGQVYTDSAVLYWWNAETVDPGSTKTIGTSYGLGEVTSAPGDLTITMSYTTNLTCVGGDLSPNPFGLTAYISNAGSTTCSGISVLLNLNPGLSTADPNPVAISSLGPSQTEQVYWDILASGNPCDTDIAFLVDVTSADCDPNSANGAVTVPCCATPTPIAVPATGPMGIGMLLFTLSGILGFGIFRRKK
jgi:hypothetical protein